MQITFVRTTRHIFTKLASLHYGALEKCDVQMKPQCTLHNSGDTA